MRVIQFVVFFSIVFTVYGLVNAYIFSRGLRTFEQGTAMRTWYIIGFWSLASTFFLGRILEKVYLSHLSDLFTWMGSFWLAAMLYLFLTVLIVDILRLANHFFPFFHLFSESFLFRNPQWMTIITAIVVFFTVLAGHINALNPRIHELSIETETASKNRKELRIVMASDIHLGTIISTKRLTKIVDKINGLNPELVLFAGDIVDEDLQPVIRQNLGSLLSQIKSPLGVFGSTGNHEYIGGADPAVEYLSRHGISMLRDTMIEVVDNVYIAGRDDIEGNRFGGRVRKSLKEISDSRKANSFLIVLDHQPRAYPEAISNKAGLVLSGHTHHGQLWPLNYITQAIFPVSWGYRQFEKTHVYVSSGLGSWGPPVRIGNRPEIVVITLKFKS